MKPLQGEGFFFFSWGDGAESSVHLYSITVLLHPMKSLFIPLNQS